MAAVLLSGHKGAPVATASIRRLVEQSGLKLELVALRADYIDHRGYADTQRLRRRLGITRSKTHTGQWLFSKHMTEETAIRILKAIDIDPVDVGL